MTARTILQRARTSTGLRPLHFVPNELFLNIRSISASSFRLDDSIPSPFQPKPHLRPEALQGVPRYSTSPSSTSSHPYSTKSSRPAEAPTKPSPESLLDTSRTHEHDDTNHQIKYDQDHDPRLHHEHLAPIAPKLPPRRRPNYQAAGFGLSGDYGRKPQSASTSSTLGKQLQRSRIVARGTGGVHADTGAAGEEPASPDLPVQPRPNTSDFTRHDRDVQVLGTGTGGNVQLSTASGSGTAGGEVIGVKGSEVRRMDQGEKDAVDGNEAEACYVPPPSTLTYHHSSPLPLIYSPNPLPNYTIAYETWGNLNADRSNAILLHTGLSASSHVASGGNGVSEDVASRKGWWEDFVGSGKAIDTDRFFVICTNTIGGCFGSTGPSSQWPHGEEGERWATRFPTLSLFDMVRAQLSLLDGLGIDRLYASIGSSMGGMQSLALAYLEPERVGRVASISATGRSGLGGVGMRFAQRSVLMSDPNWNRGFYYDGVPPHAGMKLARQIATITYRSGPEWEQRFGRKMLSETVDEDGQKVVGVPSLSPDFLIETYLDHQGERFCLTYDANSMIYLSKAMDLFDMTDDILAALSDKFKSAYPNDPSPFPHPADNVSPELNDNISSSSVIGPISSQTEKHKKKYAAPFIPTSKSPHLASLAKGLARLQNIPALILGVQSDVLFPVEQQRELADALKLAGNEKVSYYELGGVWGHDTFLLDVQGVGGAIRGFLH